MPYAVHTNITVTTFWVGEEAGPENGFIPNYASTWDGEWLRHYGGIDGQTPRTGNLPLLFTPLENAFYFALPYNDFDANGNRRPDAASIVPWAATQVWGPDDSMVKNHWIRIESSGQVAYAQWEDAGPFGENDVAYVFGTAQPSNTINAHAGLDVSPAVQQLLGLQDIDTVSWQFVDAADVPDGPWKTTITASQVDFDIANDKIATNGDDWLVGTVRNNVIDAKDGNDRVYASAGRDKILGRGGNDTLAGGSGRDGIDGGDGNDIIIGEGGNDVLRGAAGSDWLWGGAGRDVFDYDRKIDSPDVSGERDRIGDFEHGLDTINLVTLDANVLRRGNQAFTFIGASAFTGRAGQLHTVTIDDAGTANDATRIEGDTNGDGIADFSIELTGLITLTKGDFIL